MPHSSRRWDFPIRFLVLDTLFSDDRVSINTVNFNAARIWKLYGTVTRKGDNIPDRPHRRSRIILGPASLTVAGPGLLSRLSAQFPDALPEPESGRKGLDLSFWLPEHGIAIASEKPYQGGRLFVLAECPFSSAHRDGAFAIQFPSGAVFAGCHHASCGGGRQRWQELRAKFEPDRFPLPGTGEKQARPLPGTPPVRDYALTDAGNAERLVARFGDEIRFCPTFGAWYIWNGQFWERDVSRQMLSRATEVARGIYAEATAAADPERARALARWAMASESLRLRKAMIESATPLVPVNPWEFDARPDLFNCRNGTLELDTLAFREHRREDMLTRMANLAYDPAGDCPLWRKHLDLIFDHDPESIAGFQAEPCQMFPKRSAPGLPGVNFIRPNSTDL